MSPLTCFSSDNKNAIPISVVAPKNFRAWSEKQSPAIKVWLTSTQFIPEAGCVRLIPDSNGKILQVISCAEYPWHVGSLPLFLPEGTYRFETDNQDYAIVWGLGSYQFTRYKKPLRQPAKLYLTPEFSEHVLNTVEATYLVRDLINIPTDDLGPSELAKVTEELAKQYGATFKQIVGEELLKQNYASIHTVGRASDDAPRLLDLRWGNPKHKKVTLVGKGVCFDTGGLDLKAANYMLLMKKDMGGAAHALGLARMIMQAKLPICLRVLIPAVENSVSGNAYRPGDIIKSRKGLTIEVGNTDAEGRVILADALTEAASENPDLLIDLSTLTGAARVALGPDVPVIFSNHDETANALLKQGEKEWDPLWRLPLYEPYREYLISTIADINNNPTESYGGAITAGLFLKEFVPNHIPWIHIDMMAWNLRPRPGRPQGGEAMGLRALFSYLNS